MHKFPSRLIGHFKFVTKDNTYITKTWLFSETTDWWMFLFFFLIPWETNRTAKDFNLRFLSFGLDLSAFEHKTVV